MSLAELKGATVPQIALAYILRSPLNVFPLIGAATGEEFAQNLAALDLVLSEEERAGLDLETMLTDDATEHGYPLCVHCAICVVREPQKGIRMIRRLERRD